MIEILEMLDRELVASGQKNKINVGVVITGGTALLENLVDLAEQIFDLPVRIGYPTGMGGKIDEIYSPRCTTSVGLVLFGRDKNKEIQNREPSPLDKLKGWIRKIM